MAINFLQFIFPRRCAFCGQLSEDDACPDCRGALVRAGEPSPLPGGGLCIAPFEYSGPARNAVLRLKFNSRAAGVRALAGFMADALVECGGSPSAPGGANAVCSVPMTSAAIRRRGFNQAELLARAVADKMGLGYINLLQKKRAGATQSSLGLSERSANVAGAFGLSRSKSAAGLRVVLVDDVCTSGATLAECSRALKAGGAEKIWALALAKTPLR